MSRISKAGRIGILATGVSMTCFVSTAMAQGPGEAANADQETPAAALSGQPTADIIVTAQRRAESLQKVPMTVNVTTGEQLEKLSLLDIKDIQQTTPGLELTNNDGRTPTATLRGIPYNPDSGTSPAVDLYFNELPADAQTAFTAIYDINQIEVLRGPQGIFRGRTSPAGAITITSRKPNLDEPEGYFSITGTTRDAVNAQGGASVPLIPGKLALRMAALVDANKSNQVRDINLNDRRSNQQTLSGRISLAFEPTENFKALLTYQHLWSDTTPFVAAFGPGNAPLAAFGNPALSGPPLEISDRRAVSEGAPRFTIRNDLVTLQTDVNLADNIVWSTNAGYQNSQVNARRDLDSLNAVPGYAQIQTVTRPAVEWTVDSRVSSEGSGFFNWMIGGFFDDRKIDAVHVAQRNDAFGFLPAFPPALPNPSVIQVPVNVAIDLPIHDTIWALFGSARLNFTDKLRFEAGIRYNHGHFREKSFLTVCVSGACGATTQGLTPDATDRTTSAWTGGANLSYDWTPNLTTYISYGRAFRQPTITVGAAYSDLPQNLLISGSEKSDTGEIGLKASLLNRRLSLNLSAFYTKFKGYIDHANFLFVRTTDNVTGAPLIAAIPTNTNGDAVSKGIEASLTGRVTTDFDIGINASFVDAHYTDTLPCNIYNPDGTPFIPMGQPYATCDRNDRIAQVPKFTASLNGEYRFHVGSLTPFVRGLASYRPGFNSTLDLYRYRDYTNVNLYVGLRGPDDRWELSVFAKNLLDQARALSVSSGQGQQSLSNFGFGTGPGSLLSGYRSAVITPPREFGLNARFKW